MFSYIVLDSVVPLVAALDSAESIQSRDSGEDEEEGVHADNLKQLNCEINVIKRII